MVRLPPLSQSELTERQRQIYADGWNSRPGDLVGPVRAQILVPDLAERSVWLSDYLIHQTSLDERVLQLAMLLSARAWTSQYVWHAHEKLGLKAGLSSEAIDAIKQRTKPPFDREDELVTYQVFRELFDARKLTDETYARAVKCFGEPSLVELIYIIGFYSLHSMIVNTFEILPLSGEKPIDESIPKTDI